MVSSKVVRVTRAPLDGQFGPDSGRRIVVAFVPGDGDRIADLLELRPLGTRRLERIAVVDVYRYALRCRVGRELLETVGALCSLAWMVYLWGYNQAQIDAIINETETI